MIEILRGDKNLEGRVSLIAEIDSDRHPRYIEFYISNDYNEIFDLLGIYSENREDNIKSIYDNLEKKLTNYDSLFFGFQDTTNNLEEIYQKKGQIWKVGKFSEIDKAYEELSKTTIEYIVDFQEQNFPSISVKRHIIIWFDRQKSHDSKENTLVPQNNLPVKKHSYFLPKSGKRYSTYSSEHLKSKIKSAYADQIRIAFKNGHNKMLTRLITGLWDFMKGYPYEKEIDSIIFSLILSNDKNDELTALKVGKLVDVIFEDYEKAAIKRGRIKQIENSNY